MSPEQAPERARDPGLGTPWSAGGLGAERRAGRLWRASLPSPFSQTESLGPGEETEVSGYLAEVPQPVSGRAGVCARKPPGAHLPARRAGRAPAGTQAIVPASPLLPAHPKPQAQCASPPEPPEPGQKPLCPPRTCQGAGEVSTL